jgi:hypothetical protein
MGRILKLLTGALEQCKGKLTGLTSFHRADDQMAKWSLLAMPVTFRPMLRSCSKSRSWPLGRNFRSLLLDKIISMMC